MSASTEKKLRQAAREAGTDKKTLALEKEAKDTGWRLCGSIGNFHGNAVCNRRSGTPDAMGYHRW